MIALFKNKKNNADAAERLYEAVVAQSRHPVFYELYGVPDTVDGRFDLICLHAFLAMDRLFDEGRKGKKLAQALFDRMFRSLDQTLREMGVGDLSIPKHVKRMMKGFNGRATAYQEAMRAEDPEELEEALRRNLFGTADELPENALKIMALYMHESALVLEKQTWEKLATGYINFKIMDYGESEDGTEHSSRVVA